MSTNITLRNIIIGLLFAVLFIPLVVSTSLFFPYITGKGFLFRTIVEVALALYLILAIRDRSYIPRKSALTWCLGAFLVVMAIATALSENPAKSFWSNYERMEGYVTLLHLAAYFVIMAGVFTKNVWKWLLNSSLGVSVIVGAYAFGDRFANPPIERIQGTLGNSTYLGVYALIHIFLAIFLALRLIEQKGGFKKVVWPVIVYAVLGLFNVYVMYSTGTRGSFVGMLAGFVVATVLIAIFEKNRSVVRKTAIGACIAVLVAVGLLGAIKNTSFVQSSPLLSRFGALITTNVGSVIANEGYARELIWGMAWQGFKERPFFGWGQESFNYVFAEHYDPRMYNQEQWFDRSHNVFLDWLIAGGAFGLITYLSLFGAVIYLIWKKPEHEDESWTVAEKAVITGLLVAYFVHNIFVFDNLVSYLLFFILLAYVHQRSTVHGTHHDHTPLITSEIYQYVLYVVIVGLIGTSLYFGVYVPYEQNANLIYALKADAGIAADGTALPANEKGAQTLAYFKKAISQNTFGRTEVRERIAEIGPGIVTDSTDNTPETIQGYENLLQSEYLKQFAETPNDPRPYTFYGTYLLQTSRPVPAIDAFKKALALSPKKQSFLTQLAVVYFAEKDYATAATYLKEAYEEDTSDMDALATYAADLIYGNQLVQYDALAAEGLKNNLDVTTDARVIQAFYDTNNFTRLIAIAKAKIAANPNDAQTHVSAAAVYLKAGDRNMAIAEIQKAIDLQPLFKTQGDQYIKIIQAGGDPSTATATQQ